MACEILVVDDDVDLAVLLAHVLGLEGYETRVAHSARSALQLFRKKVPDLAIIDYYLPDTNGLELCKQLRLQYQVPLVMLTSRSEEAAIVHSLEQGVDDYVTKPFRPREFLARIKAILRRAGMAGPASQPAVVTAGPIRIDVRTREVWIGNEIVSLTPIEFRLLHYLAENAGQVLTFEQIIERIWGFDGPGNEDVVRVHVSRLRKKIRDRVGRLGAIISCPSVGYSLRIL